MTSIARGGRLTRGQMAAANQVSKKTLLVYEEKGLLVPAEVDEATGYRYYSWEQCSTLDMIVQLQSIGVRLSEIKSLLDRRDIGAVEALVERQTSELDRREEEVRLAKVTAGRLLDSCRLCRNPPACGVVRLEWLPRQRIIFFPIEPYRFEPRQTDENPRLRRWELALRSIKRDFVRLGLPLALFHNIGCILTKESLPTRAFICPGGYIADEVGLGVGEPRWWEEGYNLTVTIDTVFMPDGRHAEYCWVERLLDIAEANGFAIRDHYHCDILAETPALRYAGRDMMMRLHLPVDIGANAGPLKGIDEVGQRVP